MEIPFPKLLNRALRQIELRAQREMAEAIGEAMEMLELELQTVIDLKARKFVIPEQRQETNNRFVKPCWWELEEWQRER